MNLGKKNQTLNQTLKEVIILKKEDEDTEKNKYSK